MMQTFPFTFRQLRQTHTHVSNVFLIHMTYSWDVDEQKTISSF